MSKQREFIQSKLEEHGHLPSKEAQIEKIKAAFEKGDYIIGCDPISGGETIAELHKFKRNKENEIYTI